MIAILAHGSQVRSENPACIQLKPNTNLAIMICTFAGALRVSFGGHRGFCWRDVVSRRMSKGKIDIHINRRLRRSFLRFQWDIRYQPWYSTTPRISLTTLSSLRRPTAHANDVCIETPNVIKMNAAGCSGRFLMLVCEAWHQGKTHALRLEGAYFELFPPLSQPFANQIRWCEKL